MSTPKPSTPKPGIQTSVARRAAEASVRGLVVKFAPTESRLIGALRRWLQKRLPTAHELVYEYADCFVISYSPSEHGYQGVFALRASPEEVRLYFNSGKGLKDPEKLLKGTGKLVRWIDVEGMSTVALPAVLRLFDEALARNKVPFARTGRGHVIIRSEVVKKRR